MKKIIHILEIAMLALVALASTGVLYQTIASARDRLRYPPAGQLVNIGGYHLHLYCTGDGSPTVVLNGASFDTVSDWIWLQPKIAQVTRVCAYDRAGLGWSDLGPGPVDPRTNARQLRLLLEKAGIHHTSLVRSKRDSVGTLAAIREVVEAVRTGMSLRDRKSDR